MNVEIKNMKEITKNKQMEEELNIMKMEIKCTKEIYIK